MIGLLAVIAFIGLQFLVFLAVWNHNGRPATGIYRKDR